jgi:hypothetical protein
LSAAAGADPGGIIPLPRLLQAIEREYRKMGRTMPAALATVSTAQE